MVTAGIASGCEVAASGKLSSDAGDCWGGDDVRIAAAPCRWDVPEEELVTDPELEHPPVGERSGGEEDCEVDDSPLEEPAVPSDGLGGAVVTSETDGLVLR